MTQRLAAEGLGTFALVFGGVGTAVFSGFLGAPYPFVALAFGLAVVGGAYAFGPISGGHFNPAVTIGLAVGRRFPWRGVVPYIIAQIVGGTAASAVIFGICKASGASVGNMGSNGYGAGSPSFGNSPMPAGFGLWSAAIMEVVVTAIFLWVIIGVTSKRGHSAMAGLVIGLSLALMLTIAAPVDNGSLNPARSIAAAIFGGQLALQQVWVFIVFPIVGAVIAGLTHRVINKD